jgi:membrane-bound ClpP family serine protease
MSGLDPLSWAIILMFVGCALIVLEVFIPSGGLLSFLSAIAITGSIVMAFRRDSSTGLGFLVFTIFAVPTVIALAFKYWPHTPMGKAFLGELPTAEEMQPEETRRELVGRVGIAKSTMLPAGSVKIDGQLLDAVSQGTAIEVGEPVVVVEVKANRVVVRPADADEARQAAEDPSEMLSKPIDELGFDSIEDPLA